MLGIHTRWMGYCKGVVGWLALPVLRRPEKRPEWLEEAMHGALHGASLETFLVVMHRVILEMLPVVIRSAPRTIHVVRVDAEWYPTD